MKRFLRRLKQFGPGFISGAADADPSGIGTYIQAGAQFRFRLLWAETLSLPCMIGIQDAVARIGRVTGCGLAANLKKILPRWLLSILVILLTIANTINLGADLGAMGASLELVLHGGSRLFYICLFGMICLIVPMLLSYRTYARILTFLSFFLLAYVATAFVIHIPWTEILGAFVHPTVTLNKDYLTIMAAILGTDVTPFMFFWQSGQEVEEVQVRDDRTALLEAPSQAPRAGRRITLDTVAGMTFNVVISWFVILTAGLILHDRGKIDVTSATVAASALGPVAGRWTEDLFAAGMIGTGLLTVPVLAGSSGFAIGETFGFKIGYRYHAREAKLFYACLALQIILGIAMNFLKLNPMKALVYAAAVNAVVAVPLMITAMLAGMNNRLMGRFTLPRRTLILGWFSVTVMFIASGLMFYSFLM